MHAIRAVATPLSRTGGAMTGDVDAFLAFRIHDVEFASTDTLDVPLRFELLRVVPQLKTCACVLV